MRSLSIWRAWLAALVFSYSTGLLAVTQPPPNILLIVADNLGYGEIGVYGGGETRGAPTPRLNALAGEGLRLTNMNMEPQCTPSRSSLLTGRYAIRSGTYAVPTGKGVDGLPQWEITLAETLSSAGYRTALFGKWHLGSTPGRFPTDQGFDEWWGIPRSSDEAQWAGAAGYSTDIAPLEPVMEGRRGEPARAVGTYGLDQRRRMDGEIVARTEAFIAQGAHRDKPFFVMAALTQPHMPSLPHPEYVGRTGNGEWADMLAELDANVGRMLDALERHGVSRNTLVIFTSDNGAESTRPWDGWSGPWRGEYFTALEGGLRVPFIVRWPGHVPQGRVSNGMVHGSDLFTTLTKVGGGTLPTDRAIDGIDQSEFFFSPKGTSAREFIPIWVDDRLQAVKWRNFKIHFYRQDTMLDPPVKLSVPSIYNLYTDPREQKPIIESWVAVPVRQALSSVMRSLAQYPPIPMGTPDPYMPPAAGR